MIRVDYNGMHEKAEKLRKVLPSLLLEGRWEDIAEAVKVSPDIWSGKAASVYFELSQNMVCYRANGLILRLPDWIDKVANDMEDNVSKALAEVDEHLADQLTENL